MVDPQLVAEGRADERNMIRGREQVGDELRAEVDDRRVVGEPDEAGLPSGLRSGQIQSLGLSWRVAPRRRLVSMLDDSDTASRAMVRWRRQ